MTERLTAHLAIADALTRLAAGRGGQLDDVTAEVYVTDLQRFDPGLVAKACERWRTVPRKDFEAALPEVGKLIQTIERIAAEDAEEAQRRSLPAPVRDDDGPRYYCRDCHDGDWSLPRWCRGSGPSAGVCHERNAKLTRETCGRPKAHGPHTWVTRCHCWNANPNVLERQRRERAFVERKKAS